MTTALYAGSFDPITKGHVDIIKRAADIMDRVVIGVFDSPEKSLTFSTPERLGLCEKSIHNMVNVEVMAYSGLTVEFAREIHLLDERTFEKLMAGYDRLSRLIFRTLTRV